MDDRPLGHGYFFEEMPEGRSFRTFGRTVTEADLIAFVNATGFTEILFTDVEYLKTGSKIKGRVVPAMQVYAFAEALMIPIMQATGLAFLSTTIDVKGPTFVGDTIHVEGEVIEARPSSKGGSGLVRTMNRVVNHKGEVVLTYNPLRLVKVMAAKA